MAHLTREEAAIQVLRLHNRPMTPTEIVEIGTPNGFFDRANRSMSNTINVILYKAARRHPAPVVQVGNGRYGLADWNLTSTIQQPLPQLGGRPARVDNGIAQRLGERMRDISEYIQGLVTFSPERICLFIEFCHLLELHQEAVDLYQRMPKDEVDKEWLVRIERLVRVSRQHIQQ